MTGAQTRAEVTELLDRFGLAPRRPLGQHFLGDPNIVRKIVQAADLGEGSRVLEVGAGTGTLTAELAAAGHHVLAYEIDKGLQPLLSEVLDEGVDLRFEDVMSVDFTRELEGGPWALVANLPYNVGTPLLLSLMREVTAVTRFVVMMQREVVDRLVAEPGSKVYGVPSIVTALYARKVDWFSVPRQVFVPSPNVDSAVVVFDRIDAPPQAELAIRLAKAAFGQRRKMLRSSLKTAVADPIPLLEASGIDPTARAETVPPEGYVKMAERLA